MWKVYANRVRGLVFRSDLCNTEPWIRTRSPEWSRTIVNNDVITTWTMEGTDPDYKVLGCTLLSSPQVIVCRLSADLREPCPCLCCPRVVRSAW